MSVLDVDRPRRVVRGRPCSWKFELRCTICQRSSGSSDMRNGFVGWPAERVVVKPSVHTARTVRSRRRSSRRRVGRRSSTARRVCHSSVRPLRTTGAAACANAESAVRRQDDDATAVSSAVSVSVGARIVGAIGGRHAGRRSRPGTTLSWNCVKFRSEPSVNGIDDRACRDAEGETRAARRALCHRASPRCGVARRGSRCGQRGLEEGLLARCSAARGRRRIRGVATMYAGCAAFGGRGRPCCCGRGCRSRSAARACRRGAGPTP